jgi:hypothetical protein
MSQRRFDPVHILRRLQGHGVRFVLIGGMAGVVHGSPFPTEDVDITPESSHANLGRLSDALDELEAKVREGEVAVPLPFAHDAESLAHATVSNLTTRYGDLDLSLVPTGTDGYDDLIRDAVDIPLFGVQVRVASLADVIRSKQAANRPKDLRVLPTLREILARRFREDDRPDGVRDQ